MWSSFFSITDENELGLRIQFLVSGAINYGEHLKCFLFIFIVTQQLYNLNKIHKLYRLNSGKEHRLHLALVVVVLFEQKNNSKGIRNFFFHFFSSFFRHGTISVIRFFIVASHRERQQLLLFWLKNRITIVNVFFSVFLEHDFFPS